MHKRGVNKQVQDQLYERSGTYVGAVYVCRTQLCTPSKEQKKWDWPDKEEEEEENVVHKQKKQTDS